MAVKGTLERIAEKAVEDMNNDGYVPFGYLIDIVKTIIIDGSYGIKEAFGILYGESLESYMEQEEIERLNKEEGDNDE